MRRSLVVLRSNAPYVRCEGVPLGQVRERRLDRPGGCAAARAARVSTDVGEHVEADSARDRDGLWRTSAHEESSVGGVVTVEVPSNTYSGHGVHVVVDLDRDEHVIS